MSRVARPALAPLPARFWLIAALAAGAAALALGIPTVLVPSGFFVRMTPVRPLDYAVWLASAALLGPLLASYLVTLPGAVCRTGARPGVGASGNALRGLARGGREGASGSSDAGSDDGGAGSGRVMLGGLLSFLAVGCPTCNKLVVLALGATGALQYFAPLQPVLGLGSLLLLGYTLVTRFQALGLLRLEVAAGATATQGAAAAPPV